MRFKPIILILISVLICMWVLYPTFKNQFIVKDADMSVTYNYDIETGTMNERPN